MLAERHDLAADRLDEAVGKGTRAVGSQRVGHDVEIGEQLVHRVVGRTWGRRRSNANRLGRAR